MDAQSGEFGGYSWSGTLGATDIRALYARCGNLRLSGTLELSDGDRSIQVTFIGGDPVETKGGTTQEAKSWKSGSFRVEQRVPDLAGALAEGTRLAGTLSEARPKDLIRHCEDARLSCDLELTRLDGERACMRFAHGHVKSTELNGKPDMAALGRISAWSEGRFQILLQPLFAEDAPPTPPPLVRGGPTPGQLFDFTAPLRLDGDDSLPNVMPLQEVALTPAPIPVGPRGFDPTPISVTPVPLAADAPHGDDTDRRPAIAGERTALTQPLPPPPQAARAAAPDAETSMVRNPGRKRWPMVLIGLALLLGVVAAVPYVLAGFGVALPFKMPFDLPGLPAHHPPAVTPVAETPPPESPPEKPPVKVERPPRPERPPKPERPSKGERKAPERSAAELKLIERTRKLLVEGHTHTALDTLAAARKLAPKDKLLDTLEKMAHGKTGKCELVIDGKGSLVVDGVEFRAPKHLKLPAGPHLIGQGAEPEEIDLGKGEKKHLQAE